MERCPVCDHQIGPPSQHQGLQKSKLLTRNAFIDVHILVQKCTQCQILFQPSHAWLLNVGDSFLISLGRLLHSQIPIYPIYPIFDNNFLDILFLMRRLINDGSALSTVANSLLYDTSLRCETLSNLDEPKKEWISRLVTTGNVFLFL
jgi:hypothetical protein